MTTNDSVWISQREASTIVSRVLLVSALHPGEIPAATDVVLRTEQAGAEGVRLLLRVARESAPFGQTAAIQAEPAGDELNARGAPGFVVASAVADILAERDEQEVRLSVRHVRHPEFLHGVADQLPDRDVEVEWDGSTAAVVSTRRESPRPPEPDPRATGYRVAGIVWHELREIANRALSEDTVVSRSHAGATALTPEGVIKGDTDDVVSMTELEALYSNPARG